MTDRELLELAAKAAGIDGAPWPDDEEAREGLWLKGQRTPDNNIMWNPLKNDGDALRLAVKLHIDIRHFMYEKGYMDCLVDRIGRGCRESFTDDQFSATRRAIVRAAAEIGKQLGERP